MQISAVQCSALMHIAMQYRSLHYGFNTRYHVTITEFLSYRIILYSYILNLNGFFKSDYWFKTYSSFKLKESPNLSI